MTPTTTLYRGDLNDPQLANASQSQIVFEIAHTYNWWANHSVPAKRNSVHVRLAKSILLNEGIPNECLSVTPIALY